MKQRGLAMKIRPTGVIPPMTTPFRKDGEIDLKLVASQVDWLIGAGSHGMAAGGSTGEGHTLDHEEYRDLMAATVEAAKGRAPVIAGIIVDSTRDAIRRGKLVRDMDVAALQVTPVHYLFKPDEEAMVDHFRRMADETGMPIIILPLAAAAHPHHERGAARHRRQAECRRSQAVCRSHADGAGQTDLQRGRRADVSFLHARGAWIDCGDPERGA